MESTINTAQVNGEKKNKLEQIKYSIYMWKTKLYQEVGNNLFDNMSKA